jgi:hypothetical protein
MILFKLFSNLKVFKLKLNSFYTTPQYSDSKLRYEIVIFNFTIICQQLGENSVLNSRKNNYLVTLVAFIKISLSNVTFQES